MKNTVSKNFRSIALLSAGLLTAISLFLVNTNPNLVLATDDACGEVFTYEKPHDEHDHRVIIKFDHSKNSVDVTAKPGYEVTEIALDVENDPHSGFYVYANGSVTGLNPDPGDVINTAKVTIKKVCAQASSSPSPSGSSSSQPSPSPSCTTNGNGICIRCDGGGECEVIIGSPSPSASVSPSPSPSTAPSDSPNSNGSGGPSNNDSSSNNSGGGSGGPSQPAVLGVTKLAPTGSFAQNLRLAILSLGSSFVLIGAAFSALRYAQKKS